MKTIYVTQKQWQSRTLGGQLERAVGDTGRMGVRCLCTAGQPDGEDKVIDLSAWKAENLVELEEPEEPESQSGLGEYEGRELVRRPRRRHEAARNRAELAATLTVVGLMAALIVRILMF